MVPGPGEEGQDHPLGYDALSPVEALLDVVVQVHPGLEAMAGAGDALDDLVGLGELFAFFGGDGPVGGDFLGQLAETEDGEFPGELALELVDLVSDLGEGHGGPPLVNPRRDTKIHEGSLWLIHEWTRMDTNLIGNSYGDGGLSEL